MCKLGNEMKLLDIEQPLIDCQAVQFAWVFFCCEYKKGNVDIKNACVYKFVYINVDLNKVSYLHGTGVVFCTKYLENPTGPLKISYWEKCTLTTGEEKLTKVLLKNLSGYFKNACFQF